MNKLQEAREFYEGLTRYPEAVNVRAEPLLPHFAFLLKRIDELERENERLRTDKESALVELQTLALTDQLQSYSTAIAEVAHILSEEAQE